MSAGPWQPRAMMCESSTAGVASVISAVETSPVFMPRFWASSRIVFRFGPGTFSAVLGPCEILLVERLAARSPTPCRSRPSRGRSRAGSRAPAPGLTDQVVSKPVNGSRSTFSSLLDALVVAGGGDLLGAHAVAEQEDHVLRLLVPQCGRDCLFGGVLVGPERSRRLPLTATTADTARRSQARTVRRLPFIFSLIQLLDETAPPTLAVPPSRDVDNPCRPRENSVTT